MLMFDLDGTLGHFEGGFTLLREALGEVWGRQPTESELASCTGSTDWEIVSQLHHGAFQAPLTREGYEAYDRACLARFTGAFHARGRTPSVHPGIVQGLGQLVEAGHPVRLVSGNTPSVLAFKARALGVDPRIPLVGSLPGLDRTGLIRHAMGGCPGPHLYVGDRPHDRMAALAAGISFLGVGDRVPGDHVCLPVQATPARLLSAVESTLARGRTQAIDPSGCQA